MVRRLPIGLMVGAVLAAVLACAIPGCRRSEGGEVVSTVNDQLLLWATVLGAVAALPALIEFLVERRKRKERIALSLDDVAVSSLKPRLAGMDDLLESIADLIDRARNPAGYAYLRVGNEILIIGGPLQGKKMLAQVIAQRAAMDRLITVYNPRNGDALTKAKSLVERYSDEKVMLLLPGVDQAFAKDDEEVQAELEALIESTAELSNVLVIGTASSLVTDSPLDNLFGIKLPLPGQALVESERPPLTPPVRKMLESVCRFYLAETRASGCDLNGLNDAQFESRLLQSASNPAEIEDIVALCRTSAHHRRSIGKSTRLEITPDILELSIARVCVGNKPTGADDQ